jgi:hypothetical protein
MNDCGAGARWVVVGAAITADGEAVNVVLGACDRHVMGIRQYVDVLSADLGETSVVMGLEAFRALEPELMGLELGTLVAAAS